MVSQQVVNVMRSGARGLVGAMAMTGARQVSTGLGWLEKVPPEEIVHEHAPALVRSLSEGNDRAAVEVAHWAYGAGAGAAFGLLPDRLRRSGAAGPAYGVTTWLVFQLGVAPVFGIATARHRGAVSRLMLLADHVLYGVVVAGQLAPERAHAERGDAPAEPAPRA